MRKTILLTILTFVALALAMPLRAQGDSVVLMSHDLSLAVPQSERPMHLLSDTGKLVDTLQRWDFHLSLGTGVVGSRNMSASYMGVTPSFVFRPNDRLTVKGSVSALHSCSLMPAGYTVGARETRSLAPLRNPNAIAAAVDVSASYKVNDRLWIGASLLHIGGSLASGAIVNPWLMMSGPMDVDATAFTAAMRCRIGKDNYLDIHMTVVDDRTGALGPLYFGAPYGSQMFYRSTSFGGHIF